MEAIKQEIIDRAVPGPILRYLGGKWKMAQHIIEHFPAGEFDTYVELYGGSAAVLLQMERVRTEVYNDLDTRVWNVLAVMRDEQLSRDLARALSYTPFSRLEFDLAYEQADDPVEDARRMLILSWMGCCSRGCTSKHKTGFRFKDQRNGRGVQHQWAEFPERIEEFRRRLAGVILENLPALDVLSHHMDPGTLIYADPPYLQSTRTDSTFGNGRGYRHEMSDQDHIELAKALHAADAKGAMVVISGYGSDLYEDLYGDWRMVGQRSWTQNAGRRIECLWLSPELCGRLGGRLPL